MLAPTVLLVSRDAAPVQIVHEICDTVPHLCLETCRGFDQARVRLRRAGVALVLLHLGARQTNEAVTAMLQAVIAERCPCAIVVLMEDADEDRVSTLLRAGVADCLSLPVDRGRLAYLLDALTIRSRLAPTSVPAPQAENGFFDALPPGMGELADQVRRVAPQETTLLLNGETGTGKTRLARLIHQLSPRRDEPFLVIDCCALSPALIESEMFGHIKGAFTGADRDRAGKFATAGRGTLLLDEVNSLPPELQGKLLRAVEERIFEPVGSDRPQPVRARIIAASNRSLEKEVADGRFRADLFYRLNVVSFHLPVLREREGAVRSLAAKFLAEFSERNRPELRAINGEALRALEEYHWPGNIRELRNVVERLVALSPGPEVQLRDLPEAIRAPQDWLPTTSVFPVLAPTMGGLTAGTLNQTKEEAEVRRILQALEKHGNNRLRAAAELGISRMGLYKKLHKYGLFHDPQSAGSRGKEAFALAVAR